MSEPQCWCPHCTTPLPDYDPVRGSRCKQCRLVVGAGRALGTSPATSLNGGFMANSARREAADPLPRNEVLLALHTVAADIGCLVQKLRMTDYDSAQRAGAVGPTLAEVLATFQTWKHARRQAASSEPDLLDEPGHAHEPLAQAE